MQPTDDAAHSEELTRLMRAWQGGDLAARARLFDLVYARVRTIAARSAREHGAITLTPTELAHESLLRLLGAEATWADRRHFFHVVAQATRHVLVDHVRRRQAVKRGEGQEALTLGAAASAPADAAEGALLRVDQALEALAAADARRARIVELIYFGGYSREEVAGALEISLPTVDRDLRFARAWLKAELA
jgi:RNA polymerase sigma factor (TIGR02999 family)